MINTLLDWMVGQHLRQASPLRAVGSTNPLSTGMSRDMDIRHLTLGQYVFLRDVGLGGQSLDGDADRAFRGHVPNRSRAAADLALTSGMRPQEWSPVLLPELAVGMRRPGEGADFGLPACAKYQKHRIAYAPPDASYCWAASPYAGSARAACSSAWPRPSSRPSCSSPRCCGSPAAAGPRCPRA